jgi:hypothetical protein
MFSFHLSIVHVILTWLTFTKHFSQFF